MTRKIDIQYMKFERDQEPTARELRAMELVETPDRIACRIDRCMGPAVVRVGTIARHVADAQAIEWHDVPWAAL